MHQDEEEQTGDGQTFDEHGKERRILFRNENDEIDGWRLEERDEFGADALQLRRRRRRGRERKTDKFESTRLDGINQSTTVQIDKRQAGYKGQYQANLFTGIDDNEIKDLRHSIVERDRRGKSLYLPLVWVTSLQLLLFLFAWTQWQQFKVDAQRAK